MGRQKPLYYVLIIIVATGYGFIAFSIERWETHYLIPVYGILFMLYGWIIRDAQPGNVSFWLITALLFRIIFLFSLPTLSDDFYRFIWDGRLWNAGYHPFAALPSSYVQQGITGIDQTLFSKLNSPEYFTIYPPVSQLVFWVSAKISPQSILGSVIVMRVIMLLAEAGSFFIMLKLLKRFRFPSTNILIYALNPLVIIELTGNLHFEALVIFFVLLSVYLLLTNHWIGSALSMATAVGAKLVPLILIPALVGAIGIKKSIRYGGVTILFLLILFFPLLDWQVFQSMSKSLGLYFNKFEFNASLYYLVREYGFWKYGYNIIQTAGWKLGLIAGILILLVSFRKGLAWDRLSDENTYPSLITKWMWSLSIYFLFTTILHPWYITTLLALSVFTTYRFPLVWTGLVFLSYSGYNQKGFQENLWFTTLEYLLVIGYLIFELKSKRVLTFSLKKNEI